MSENSKKDSPPHLEGEEKKSGSQSNPLDESETIVHAEEKTIVHPKQEEKMEPSEKEEGAKLSVLSGPLSGNVFPLNLKEGESFVIGRGQDCELTLDDGSVSRRHVEIRRQGPFHTISDLGSSNGTLVNNQLIHQGYELQNNSEIKIGVYSFIFSDPHLKQSDASFLPVPYKEETASLAQDDSILYKTEKPPRVRYVLWGYSLFALLVIFLLFFGIRTILQEEESGFSDALFNIFGPGGSPKLAYPLLEIKTTPLSGEIFFQNEFLGNSPLEKKLEKGVQPGTSFELKAEFDLPSLDEKVAIKKMVQFDRNQEVSSHILEAPIGQIHIKKIPKNTQVLLEFTKEDNPSEENPQIKLIKVDYKDPILVPFGKFKLEIRQDEKFRYRRRFDINQSEPLWIFEVTDDDLTFTLVNIETEPSGASILIDGTLINEKTPLRKYRLSFGSHHFLLKKENYKDYLLNELPDPIEINEPLEFKVELPISPVGELILQAKREMEKESNKAAENTLFNALKTSPPPTSFEQAEIQYLLGEVYLGNEDHRQAKIYFHKAMRFKDKDNIFPFLDKAKLGLARVNLKTDKKDDALRQSVEVFFSSDDLLTKSKAQEVFHQVSPIKSVIYIDTIPSGAQIFLNGRKVKILNRDNKKIPAKTPTIIPGLPRGSYNILLTKEGYLDEKQNIRLDISDLIPVKVELKPR